MRKAYIFGLVALICLIIGFAWAEQITLTTYYPSPYGVYKQMRLFPTDDITPGSCINNGRGALFYSNSSDGMYLCNGSDWVPHNFVFRQTNWIRVTNAQLLTSAELGVYNIGDINNMQVTMLFAPPDPAAPANPDMGRVAHMNFIQSGAIDMGAQIIEMNNTNFKLQVANDFCGYLLDNTGQPSARFTVGFYKLTFVRFY